MPQDSPPIIADRSDRLASRRGWWLAFAATLTVGVAGAAWYAVAGLTLSHYDARAHLVVARRIFDSLRPGWEQIGAIWLPLPHLINAVPVQWDWAYRTGAIATLVSVGSMALGLAALGSLVARRTGSLLAATAAPLVILLNPNVLYLQSTPMTEPLLFGLALMAIAATDAWVRAPASRERQLAGWLIVAMMLTRYEGWFIGCGLAVVGGWAVWREGRAPGEWFRLLPYPAGAVVGFMVLSKATVGAWFVTGGFYEANNPAMGRPFAVAGQIVTATSALGGSALVAAGGVGLVACLWWAARRPALVLPVTLVFSAALPFIAFHAGHPLRVRYMVPLVVAAGALAGLAAALLPRRLRGAAVAGLLAATVWQRAPLDEEAPMLREAQWETPYRLARAPVTEYLDTHWDGTPIFASMGSLAHYMQELSAIEIGIGDFVHEGTGDLWRHTIVRPAVYVRWMLIEERAEGGDQLAALAAAQPEYLAGFTRVAAGGGVALYERTNLRTGRGSRR